MKNFFWTVLTTMLLSACAAVGPEYVQPEAPLPDAWQKGPAGLKATQYELVDWWGGHSTTPSWTTW